MSVNNGSDIYNNGLTSADVKDIVDNLPEFQAKADAKDVVFIADAYANIGSITSDDRWFKLVEITYGIIQNNLSVSFDVFGNRASGPSVSGLIEVNIRGNASGTPLVVYTKNFYSNNAAAGYDFKLVTIGNAGNSVVVQIWVKLSNNNSNIALSLRKRARMDVFPNLTINFFKNPTRTSEPQSDIATDTVATLFDLYIRQPAIFDNYPTKNSTSLVNSGKLYDVFTDDNGDQMTEAPPQQVYVVGKFYFVAGKVCRCTAYNASSATFDAYGVVEAMNYILSQV